MYRNKKFLLVAGLLTAIIIGSAATMPQADEKPEFKNLKVLPKKISHDELRDVMKSWNAALGVKCNFCHVPLKDDPQKLDYASDAKSEKNMARSMYKMTSRLNKKYFSHEKSENGAVVWEVNCITCHSGKKHPEK